MVRSLKAFIFDMDGVVTDTAEAHFHSWKRVFDEVLRRRAEGSDFHPFTREDYLNHVDGVPRYEGVRRFLSSRGIETPEGGEDDACPDTVRGIGNFKNRHFRDWLDRNQVPVFDDARELIAELRRLGTKTGVFSASRNARRVLESAEVGDLFDATVDGTDAQEMNLAGKPDPAVLMETARRLGCEPGEAAVVEDATAGVEAGARGHFALVVSVRSRGEAAEAGILVSGRLSNRAAWSSHAASLHAVDVAVRCNRSSGKRAVSEPGSMAGVVVGQAKQPQISGPAVPVTAKVAQRTRPRSAWHARRPSRWRDRR